MEKQLLFLLILLVIKSNNLFSQQYQPFPESKFSWIVLEIGPRPRGPGPDYSKVVGTGYETSGDTVINGLTYIKIIKRTPSNNSVSYFYDSIDKMRKPFINLVGSLSEFSFAYRNDVAKKQVYIYTKTYTNWGELKWKELLWYDFNLKAGDTLKPTFSFDNIGNPENERGIILDTFNVLICGVYHKAYFFCNDNLESALIEGVGFQDDFFQTKYETCPFEDTYIYETFFYSSTLSLLELTNSVQTIQLFPNPATDYLSIKETNIQPVAYTIIDCLGRPVFSDAYASGVDIDVSKLTTGIYFIQLKDKNNNLYQGKFIKE